MCVYTASACIWPSWIFFSLSRGDKLSPSPSLSPWHESVDAGYASTASRHTCHIFNLKYATTSHCKRQNGAHKHTTRNSTPPSRSHSQPLCFLTCATPPTGLRGCALVPRALRTGANSRLPLCVLKFVGFRRSLVHIKIIERGVLRPL